MANGLPPGPPPEPPAAAADYLPLVHDRTRHAKKRGGGGLAITLLETVGRFCFETPAALLKALNEG